MLDTDGSLKSKKKDSNNGLDPPNADYLSKLLSSNYHDTLKYGAEALPVEGIIETVIDYYETIIDHIPGNVYWLDRDGVGVGCNKDVLQMFGFTSMRQFKGLTFEQMGKVGKWSPATTQSFKRDTLEVVRTGKAKLNVEEPPIPHANGKVVYFLTSRVPLFDRSGDVIAVVGISVDITERKEMELELKQAKEHAEIANNAKTEFLQNMRHDLRTPLSGIVGLADLLNDETNFTKIKEYTSALKISSNELLRFLNDVLESINIASGDIPLAIQKFNLKSIINDVIKLNYPKALEKNLTLELNFDNTIPECLSGDSARIYRVGLELLTNALKYTEHGSITVRARLAEQHSNKLTIMLVIEDTGSGIPKEKQQEIFAPFKRLTPSYRGIHKGSGLGLSIVKKFIDDLGGKISVHSEPGVGTKFTCFFPLYTVPAETTVTIAAGLEVAGANKPNMGTITEAIHNTTATRTTATTESKMTTAIANKHATTKKNISILIVEDHEVAATIAKNVMSNLGCTVDVATNGKTAINLSNKNKYDLILMDIGLPDLDGYEVSQHIRTEPASLNRNSPIVGLTAHADEEHQQLGLNSGMNTIFMKPLLGETASKILASLPKWSSNNIAVEVEQVY